MPGIWRNICPLAAANQIPRLFGFSRGFTLSPKVKHYAYVIGITIFFSAASSRKWLFNHDGIATAALLLTAISLAFVGGLFFKGKSGWCSTFCPVLPIQRAYGQTPFIVSPNSHCQPCLGCIKNCYDFNPHVAYIADMYDEDRRYAGYRRFFISAFPGFILGYFIIPNPPDIPIFHMYALLLLSMFISIAIFNILETFAVVTLPKLTTIFGALCFNIYYWFAIPDVMDFFGVFPGTHLYDLTVPGQRLALGVVTLIWILRTYRVEKIYLSESTAVASKSTLDMLKKSGALDQLEVVVCPSDKVVLSEPKVLLSKSNESVLDIARDGSLNIDEGCRAGACGADPIVVLEGMENLSPPSGEELATLKRLGLSSRCRMACCARILGPVKIEIGKEALEIAPGEAIEVDKSVRDVVIIGNGAAGQTAAETIREMTPDCKITLISREPHNFYNRLFINELIVNHKGFGVLNPLSEEWYEKHEIENWINTKVISITEDEQKILLGTGQEKSYDRLIIATGSQSYVAEPFDINLPGVFVVREANDTMAIRAYIQEHQVKHAIVVGSGALGIETAHTLYRVGVKPIVLSKSSNILSRHIDFSASDLVVSYLVGLGIDVVPSATTKAVIGNGHLEGVELQDGRKIECQLAILCTGIVSNTSLVEGTSVKTNSRGILVEPTMETGAPNIYAAGDVAEVRGVTYGLWTVAVEQGRIAAQNALGGKKEFIGSDTPMILKIEGLDIVCLGDSLGKIEGCEFMTYSDLDNHRYARLAVIDSKLVGAILVGMNEYFPALSKLIRQETDLSEIIQDLKTGEFKPILKLA